MVPKVIFRYSWIYDENWKKWIAVYKIEKSYLSSKQILKYSKEVEIIWNKDEKRVLSELAKISKLKWKAQIIKCYVVGKAIPFSDPLTLPVYKDKERFVDVLVHELIHQLFTQKGNLEKSRKAWSYFHKKYKNESVNTIIHIPLHAIYYKTYLKCFDEERAKRDMEIMSKFKDYKRAWEIVQKEGYENIIKEFVKRID